MFHNLIFSSTRVCSECDGRTVSRLFKVRWQFSTLRMHCEEISGNGKRLLNLPKELQIRTKGCNLLFSLWHLDLALDAYFPWSKVQKLKFWNNWPFNGYTSRHLFFFWRDSLSYSWRHAFACWQSLMWLMWCNWVVFFEVYHEPFYLKMLGPRSSKIWKLSRLY